MVVHEETEELQIAQRNLGYSVEKDRSAAQIVSFRYPSVLILEHFWTLGVQIRRN